MKLKDEFTFNYNGQEIKVQKTGEVHSAIFGKLAKPLKIVLGNSGPHHGKIFTWEGKFLSFIPNTAFDYIDPTEALKQIKEILKQAGI